VLQAAVDRFGWTVAGAGPVEVGQYVSGSLAQGAAELGDLDQRPGDAGAERLDQLDHQLAARGWVGVPVGGDHPLVDAPGGLDLDVLIDGEQGRESGGLLVGEQVGTGVQGSPGTVERVVLTAAAAAGGLLNAAAAVVEGVAGQAHHVEGVHHRDRGGDLLSGGGLEAGEPVHRDDLHGLAPRLGALGKPGLERGLGAARDHVQQPRWTRTGAHRREVDDHGDVLVPAAGVAPHVLIDPDDLHTVQPAGIVDQHPSALGQDRVVGGVPRDAEPLGDASDAQVLTHDRLQRPGQSTTRQPGPRLGRAAGVLAPHMPTPGAPVPADRHQQGGRSPAQRLVRQLPRDGVPESSCTPAASAPALGAVIGLQDPARQDRAIGLQTLAHHD
jgi:hypothetical protein